MPALLAALALAGCAHIAKHGESRQEPLLVDSCAKPVYPREDRPANHQETVRLKFLVHEEGQAVDG